MHAAHSSTLRRVRSFSGLPLTMSASASRPPGRSTRAASAKTRLLTTERLITPLEMTASNVASSNGSSSMLASTKLDVREAVAVAQPRGLRELLGREVDADDAAGRADLDRRAERVGARAGPEVEHRLARSERREVEVVADAGERGQRLRGDRVEQRSPDSRAAPRGGARPRSAASACSSRATWPYISLTFDSSSAASTSELASACGSPSASASSAPVLALMDIPSRIAGRERDVGDRRPIPGGLT